MSQDELIEEALWFQVDARYLYEQADMYRTRDRSCDWWLACKVQENTAAKVYC